MTEARAGVETRKDQVQHTSEGQDTEGVPIPTATIHTTTVNASKARRRGTCRD